MRKTAWLTIVLIASFVTVSPARASTYDLDSILPPADAERLGKAGVRSTEELLARGATPQGRRALAKDTGLAETKLQELVRMSDLLRVRGIGPLMVKLLNAAQVTTVAEFRRQKAKPLFTKLVEINNKERITEKTPTEKHLENWLAQAQRLKIVVR